MTVITTFHPSGALHARFSRLFASIGEGLVAYADRRSRRALIEELNELSDSDLAARGISRDQIVAHVFRDRLLSL